MFGPRRAAVPFALISILGLLALVAMPACRERADRRNAPEVERPEPASMRSTSVDRMELAGLYEPQWPAGYRTRFDEAVRRHAEVAGLGEVDVVELRLLEDGRALGPRLGSSDEVRELGGGRYAYENGFLFFSASDDTDPNRNGRTYEVEVRLRGPLERAYRTLPVVQPFAGLDPRSVGSWPLAPGEARRDAPRVVYLYVVDAMRAELPWERHDGQPLMPELARFAEEAVVFERAYASSGFTKTSVASLFTGLFACRTRVMGGVLPVYPSGGLLLFGLDPRFDTLAERLAGVGYRTRTHVFTDHTRQGDTLLQGFDHVDEKHLILDEAPGRLFVYEHILGVHGPYRPDLEARRRFGLTDDPVGVRPYATDWYSGPLTDADGETLHRWYRAEAPAADAAFAERRRELEERGDWDDALVIVTADHGEAFLEHAVTQHASSLYEEVIHVPLIIKFPRGSRFAGEHGTRIPNRVRHVDLLPTVLDLVGAGSPPYGIDGHSLLPILEGREPEPDRREVLARLAALYPVGDDGNQTLLGLDAVLAGSLKVHVGYHLASSQQPEVRPFGRGGFHAELYDLSADPGEQRDLATDRGDDLARLVERRNELCVPLAAEGTVEPPPPQDAADEDLLERLRELGYAD